MYKYTETPTYHYFAEQITQFYNQAESKLLKIIEDNITVE